MIPGLNAVEVITIFTEDLAATRAFYTDVFGLKLVFEDDVSAALLFDNMMINVLHRAAAPELVTPLPVAEAGQGARAMLTINVDDCDAICAALAEHGVALLNGPIDRPWGRRTAAFADPAGTVWEVAQNL